MLKDLFSNRLFLGGLCFFVLMVVGGLLYMQHVERQAQKELARPEEVVKQWNERQNPTAEDAIGDTSQGGHWHGDEGHEKDTHTGTGVSATKQAQRRDKKEQMSPEDIAALEKERRAFFESFGLEPPPPGYRYVKIGDAPPKLINYKEVIYQVAWGEGYGNYHQLTDTELVRYSCLLGIEHPSVISRYGLSQEEIDLGLAWKQELYEKTKGPRPTIHATTSRPASDPQTPEEREAMHQRMREMEDELLPPPPDSFRVDYDVFDQIIADLRTTLQRR